MEEHNQEALEERNRREAFFRMIEKTRNIFVPSNVNQQKTSRKQTLFATETQSEETMSTSSNDSPNVPAINVKNYLGATGVLNGNSKRWNVVETE